MEKFVVDSEDTPSISAAYNSIQTGLIEATQRHHIIPDLSQLHAEFNISDYIFPPVHSPVYESSLAVFIFMSRALNKLLVDSKTFNTTCTSD